MRRCSLIVLVSMSCGAPTRPPHSPTSGPGSTPPPAAASAIEAEVVTDLTAASFGRPASISHVDSNTLTIDEGGRAQFTGQTPRWIPFSEPVDDVVFVKTFAYPQNVPGAQLGKMFCARTRSSALECVIDFTATPKAAQLVRRLRLPVEGGVAHIGVLSPWPGTSGPDRVVCTLGTATSCWVFDWAGTRAHPYPVEPAVAEAAALRIAQGVRAPWLQAVPTMTPANIREVVHTEAHDQGRVAHPITNVSVHCALLVSGELSCFGPGVYGELGDGALTVGSSRASRPLGDTKVVDVATTGYQVCAAVADGRVACWGEVYEALPVPKRHKTTPLQMCKFDRSASKAKFVADLAAEIEAAKSCAKGCDSRGRDGCLGCGVKCVDAPYLFRRDTICQVPMYDTRVGQDGIRCFDNEQEARWLTDAELRADTPERNLTLAPVYLTGITDAIGITVAGPRLCVLRRGGAIACLENNGTLSPLR